MYTRKAAAGTWQTVGKLSYSGGLPNIDQIREALRQGRIKAVSSRWPTLEAGGSSAIVHDLH